MVVTSTRGGVVGERFDGLYRRCILSPLNLAVLCDRHCVGGDVVRFNGRGNSGSHFEWANTGPEYRDLVACGLFILIQTPHDVYYKLDRSTFTLYVGVSCEWNYMKRIYVIIVIVSEVLTFSQTDWIGFQLQFTMIDQRRQVDVYFNGVNQVDWAVSEDRGCDGRYNVRRFWRDDCALKPHDRAGEYWCGWYSLY